MTEENSEILNTESEVTEEAKNQDVTVDNNELDSDNEITTDADAPSPEGQTQSKSQGTKQRLRRRLREEQAEKARILAANEEMQKRLNELAEKVDPLINPPPQRPNRVDFETEEDYEDSLFEWRDKLNQRKSPEPVTKPVVNDVVSTQNVAPLDVSVEAQQNWVNQMDLAADKYDDFEDVLVSIPKESVTDSMTLTIMESDKAGEIAYFLGKNHAEAARISKLSIANQIREIDKLGNKFKTTTSAPDPINTITHKGDTTDKVIDPLLDGASFE